MASLPPQDLTQQSGHITHLESNLCQAHQKYNFTVHVLCNLRHSPPQMKNQHDLNEEKTIIGEKINSQLSASDMTHVVSLDTNNKRKS